MVAIPHNRLRTFLQFLFVISILEPSVASTWFARRDMLWDDSLWLDDAIGVGVGGGIGVLYEILNKMTNTKVQPTRQSPDPVENPPDQEGSQPATPNEQGPLSVPFSIKKCSTPKVGAPDDQSNGGLADVSGDLVKQDPITG